VALCQEQDLGIKPEALDPLLLKNDRCPFTVECFEAALRVGKIDPCDPADQTVKQVARLLAKCGLVNFD
jgi:hypothetical protein